MKALSRHWRAGLRLVGALALALGAVALLSDLHIIHGGLDYRPAALGEYWHQWHAPSLNLVQAIVERYVSPQLWSAILLPLLLAPAWMAATITGALLLGISVIRKSA